METGSTVVRGKLHWVSLPIFKRFLAWGQALGGVVKNPMHRNLQFYWLKEPEEEFGGTIIEGK